MSAADLPTLLAIPAPEAAPTYLPPPLTSEVALLTMKEYRKLTFAKKYETQDRRLARVKKNGQGDVKHTDIAVRGIGTVLYMYALW